MKTIAPTDAIQHAARGNTSSGIQGGYAFFRTSALPHRQNFRFMELTSFASLPNQVVVLGDSQAGKTSLVTRFAEGYYRENSRPPTLGAFFVTKRIQTSNNMVDQAAAVIVCYDVTRRRSYDAMTKWLDRLRRDTPGENDRTSSPFPFRLAMP